MIYGDIEMALKSNPQALIAGASPQREGCSMRWAIALSPHLLLFHCHQVVVLVHLFTSKSQQGDFTQMGSVWLKTSCGGWRNCCPRDKIKRLSDLSKLAEGTVGGAEVSSRVEFHSSGCPVHKEILVR